MARGAKALAGDRRLTPARPDLAADYLKGKVEAKRFAAARRMQAGVPVVPVTARPDAEGAIDTQLLFGEPFDLYEEDGGWAWGQCPLDAYVGYVPAACLEMPGPEPTHRVAEPLAHVYPEPAFKSRPGGVLPYGARVAVADEGDARFAALAIGGFIAKRHLASLAAPARDWVAEAERLIGLPYLWGGRSAMGLDCSALIQLALQAAGRECLRDSDMQEATLGKTLPEGTKPERGDLLFWKSHVGVMVSPTRLLHANIHHMAVAKEPLAPAVRRIEKGGDGQVTRHARLDL